MVSGKITKTSVDEMQPNSAGKVWLWDTDLKGFGLQVTPAGAKSYIYQFRMGGREAAKKRYTIGRHGSPWTPASARDECKRLSLLVGQGIDPADADRERRRQAVDLAFAPYAALFVKDHLRKAWSDWRAGERLILNEAVPVLGNKPITLLKRADLAVVLDRLADRPASARLAHATLRKLFKWAEGRGDIDRSPLDGMPAPAPVAARDRVLSDRELSLVWRAAGALEYPFGPIVKLLILTGQRREEVSGLTWAEMDRKSATWTLPAARAKNDQAHLVPLAIDAVAICDVLAPAPPRPADGVKWPSTGLLFSTTGKTAVSGHSKAKARLDALITKLGAADAESEGHAIEPLQPWRLHDLRRTLATGMQRLGVRFEVTEAILNHVSGAKSGVAGIYQRHDWKDEKRDALARWADHVAGLIKCP